MNTKTPNKTWIWVIVIVVIAAIAYFYFYGSNNQSSGLSATSDNNALVGARVLGLLGQIQRLRIDTTLFTDPGYKTLRDYSVVIPPVSVGRPNPFAPLSGAQTMNSSTAIPTPPVKIKKTP